ncbi:hypothetical protein HJJEPNFP_00004 [Ralstonia phage BOESR1]|nr:hypothetical protein HJJEPNFP_00004 [Ralstonia phage BOESR1]
MLLKMILSVTPKNISIECSYYYYLLIEET